MSTVAAVLTTLVLAQAPAAPPVAAGEIEYPVRPIERREPERHFVVFSHKIHAERRLKTKCIDCHLLSVDGNRFRPTTDAQCATCHKGGDPNLAAFRASLAARPVKKPTGPLEPLHQMHLYYNCNRCHANMALSDKVGDFPLPPNDNTAESCVGCHNRAVQFSHARHVNVEGKVAADCAVCHSVAPGGVLYSNPGHPQCFGCHDIRLLGLVEGCNLCHLKDARAPKSFNLERAWTFHRQHPRDKVPCQDCHAPIMTATSLEELTAARVASATAGCTRCHVIPK